jgi:multiple antibiotic resistance protein
MDVRQAMVDVLYLLALINPVSKISILAVSGSDKGGGIIRRASVEATFVAALLLLLVVVSGDFILRQVFRVDFYSLQVAGGIVLAWVGFGGLTKGQFFERSAHVDFSDIALVPLACPMIAGPATITATLNLSIHRGLPSITLSLMTALAINLCLMLLSGPIAKALSRHNLLGALVRITGLVVIAIGVQMTLDGLSTWMGSVEGLTNR